VSLTTTTTTRAGKRAVCALVTVTGDIDTASAAAFTELLADLLRWPLSHVVVDASRVNFIDWRGYRFLLNVRQTSETVGATFDLRTPFSALLRLHALLTKATGRGFEGSSANILTSADQPGSAVRTSCAHG
jgi:anti-anti-sigma factor